jgi:ParB family transcriptional regulator, chromosome partitioning protein
MSQQQPGRDGIEWIDPLQIEIVKDVSIASGAKPEKDTIFKNPRTLQNPGFSPEKMAELRQAVIKDGLKQPLEVRKDGGAFKLVAGERRLRSILWLREHDTLCYNRNTKQLETASKVYAQVPCVLIDCKDDRDALRHAILENVLHEHLTDYELLLQCNRLQEAGYSRAEQAEIFQKSEAWISQSHSLLECPSIVLEYMSQGILGRTQALQFLNVPAEKTEEVLKNAMSDFIHQARTREEEAVREQDAAWDKIEELESEMKTAQVQGNKEVAKEARLKLAEVNKEAEKATKKIKQAKSSRLKRKLSVENIQAGQKKAGVDGNKQHQSMKTVREVYERLSGLYNKGESLVNPDTDAEYDRNGVKVIIGTLDWVLNRTNNSPLDVLDADYQVPIAVEAAK